MKNPSKAPPPQATLNAPPPIAAKPLPAETVAAENNMVSEGNTSGVARIAKKREQADAKSQGEPRAVAENAAPAPRKGPAPDAKAGSHPPKVLDPSRELKKTELSPKVRSKSNATSARG